jgi:cellulose synthase/poly-beta-1,6-N-acetylglucosamine synthase-like glycosyltransferase
MTNIVFDRSWELIVVDNASSDDTALAIRKFNNTASIQANYLLEAKRGKSHALNSAIQIARGQILAFIDDDCYPAPDFLQQIWKSFEDPFIGYISGRIVLHDPSDYPITINESTTPRNFPARSFIPSGAIQGANMAFRRSILIEIGGFDPLFGPGAWFAAAEDVEAASRASDLGWMGQYCPNVIVRHHHRRKASDVPALCKSYAIGRGAYHMKLLLSSHKISWFARGLYQLSWRYKQSRGTILWEQVGAAQYAYLYFLHSLRSCRKRYAVA